MNTFSDQTAQTETRAVNMLLTQTAANDDRVSNAKAAPLDPTIGWNSYEVWRRLIKDVHDRRVASRKLAER
jgi:hypothetical protein